MANANTIAGFFGGTGRNQIVSQTLASTAATAFQVQTDSGTPVVAVLTVPQASAITGAANPLDPNANPAITGNNYGAMYGRPNGTAAPWYSSTSFDFSRPFTVRISGTGTSAAAVGNTLTLTIYVGTSTSGTAIAATSAVATATALALDFMLETTVTWSAANGNVAGFHDSIVAAGSTATIQTQTANSAVAAAAAASNLQFVASATWGNAAGGTLQVTEFVIEQI